MEGQIFYLFGLLVIDFLVLKYVVIDMVLQCRKLLRFRRSSLKANGTIVGFHTKEDLNGHTQYASIVKFLTTDGHTHTIRSDEFRMTKPNEGKQVVVNYNPNYAENAIEELSSKINFRIFLILFMSVILAGINYTTIASFF